LALEQKPLDPFFKPVRGVVRQQVKRDLLAAHQSVRLC